ncbi:hypothetical protein POM88_019057 [Heracleum sosnowskyi]|uniref:Endonuclease/exonuclease/phosphatase domain-containing protein n=1 Tax=Heracleum sosnowskyi TaxID=360622 RepID=A0AAD8IRM9_9APIA|nr:hypothetical protein POM88_019057 [Heracleum sosnowskyi]
MRKEEVDSERPLYQIQNFRNVVDECGIKELKTEAVEKHLSFWGSDHSPLLIEFSGCVEGRTCGHVRRSRFCFDEAWAEDQECEAIIKENWSFDFGWNLLSNVKEKLRKGGKSLHKWGLRKRRKDTFAEIKKLEENLAVFSRYYQWRDWQARREEEKKLNKLLLMEEIYWKQRSRVLWLA